MSANDSAGRIVVLHPSISASSRFTRPSIHCIGQAVLRVGRFARVASESAGEQTAQKIETIHEINLIVFVVAKISKRSFSSHPIPVYINYVPPPAQQSIFPFFYSSSV